MIEQSDLQFSGYQAAAFYTGLRFTTGRILRQLLERLDDVLDGDPISLPVPSDAPAEIPRLFLTSKDHAFRLDLSLARVDFRWQRSDSTELALERFTELARRAFHGLHDGTKTRPGRLALIVHRYKVDDQPGLALARHFCRPELLVNLPDNKGPLNRPEAFEVHAFKRFQVGPFTLNSWVRCKSGTLTTPQEARPVVLVEQDLNTPHEVLADTQFSDDDIRDFCQTCSGELASIIRLYFPDHDRRGSASHQ